MIRLLNLLPYLVMLAVLGGVAWCCYRWGYGDGANDAYDTLARLDPHLDARVDRALDHHEHTVAAR